MVSPFSFTFLSPLNAWFDSWDILKQARKCGPYFYLGKILNQILLYVLALEWYWCPSDRLHQYFSAKWVVDPRKDVACGNGSRSSALPQLLVAAQQRRLGRLTSPSGVSDGQSIPHWDGCRDRGPLTFLVFSNWEEILVIMPNADMYDKRDSTWVTPWRSILNLFRDQFPCTERKDVRWHWPIHMLSYSLQSLWVHHRN